MPDSQTLVKYFWAGGLVGSLVFGAVPAGAQTLPCCPVIVGDCAVKIQDQAVSKNAAFELLVFVDDPPGSGGTAKFTVAYNANRLTYLRAVPLSGGSCTSTVLSAGARRVVCAGITGLEGDGYIASLRFRAGTVVGQTVLPLSDPGGFLQYCTLDGPVVTIR